MIIKNIKYGIYLGEKEAMVFIGAFQVWKVHTIIAIFGIIITAGYLLWTLQRVFFGETNPKYLDIKDINGRELFTLIPLGIIVIFLGIWPHPVLDLMNSSLSHLANMMSSVTPL